MSGPKRPDKIFEGTHGYPGGNINKILFVFL